MWSYVPAGHALMAEAESAVAGLPLASIIPAIIALGLLVAYYEIIQQGALATRTSGFSPWVTQWLPLALLAAFSLWRFYVVSFRLGGEGLDRWLVPLQEFASRLTTRFLALFGIRRGEA